MRQTIWIPKGEDVGAPARKCPPVPVDNVPSRVWTMFGHREESDPPSLNVKPRHHVNAFLEDAGHDWHTLSYDGQLLFQYHGVDMQGGVWVLLEFRDLSIEDGVPETV